MPKSSQDHRGQRDGSIRGCLLLYHVQPGTGRQVPPLGLRHYALPAARIRADHCGLREAPRNQKRINHARLPVHHPRSRVSQTGYRGQ